MKKRLSLFFLLCFSLSVAGQNTFNHRIHFDTPAAILTSIVPTDSAVHAAKHLAAFPNPARNSVVFHWNLPEGMENGTILLSDLQGRTIETLEITGQQGKIEWNTEQLKNGVYLCQLRLPDGRFETSRLTIIK